MEIQIMKIISAVFYGFVSLFITLALKAILTIFKFPSVTFVGLCQIISTICLSLSFKCYRVESLNFSFKNIVNVFPLPIFYILDILMGLFGTMELNLPMFTVLRRISNVLLLIAEIIFLKSHHCKISKISIFLMLLGSVVAALNDLSFSLTGYTFVMVNNISTVVGGIYLKLKQRRLIMNDLEIVFFNALVAFLPLLLIFLYTSDFDKVIHFKDWENGYFLLLFSAACSLGALLKFSMVLCTQYNGPLTTSIIGVAKNIIVTYIGMHFAGDYIFNWKNFIGINISMFGAILYISKNFKFKMFHSKTEVILKL